MAGHWGATVPLTRGTGAVDALGDLLPDLLVFLFVAVTQLGDVWFYVGLLTLYYWFVDREYGVRLVAVGFAGVGLTLTLKYGLALPRPAVQPPVAVAAVPDLLRGLYARSVAPGGFGFPSGHALGATVVYGGLAWGDGRLRRDRVVAASVVVALVSLSRVALGVHYLVDVVGGILLGIALLVALRAAEARDLAAAVPGVPGDRPGTTTMLVTSLFCVPAALVAGREGHLALAGALGVLVAWTAVDVPRAPWPSGRRAVPAAVAGGALVVAPPTLLLAASVPFADVLAAGVGVAAIVVAPAVVPAPRPD